MNKQKRMIYVYDENVEFYDSLENKSEFLNRKLTEARKSVPNNSNIEYVRTKVAQIDNRGKQSA